jgi:hypothetical protein
MPPLQVSTHLSNDQVRSIVTYINININNSYNCNSICLAASTVASKGSGPVARNNAKETQFNNKMLHYKKVTPIYRVWMATALVATRACNKCGECDNVCKVNILPLMFVHDAC